MIPPRSDEEVITVIAFALDKKAAELLGLKVKSMGDILTDDECTVAPAVGTAVMMEKYLN